MTRATLLHVLENTSALGAAEVRELEQLAQAFPYCQTAHLLLAKAAHDQGTMLAGQRLRRAATYAADRALLRRLIEHVEPAAEPTEIHVDEAAAAPEAVFSAAPEPVVAPVAPVQPTEPELPQATETLAAAETTVAVASDVPDATEPPAADSAPPAPLAEEVPDVEPSVEQTDTPEQTPEAETSSDVPAPQAAESILLLDVEGVEIGTTDSTTEIFFEPETEPEPAAEDDLPAQAPAIRPPVEVGEARFEFGLAEPPAPAAPTYELPGLVDEWAASAVTRSLGSLDPLPSSASPAKASAWAGATALTPAAFTGDETVGYGFGESSRLGFSMQLLSLLADKAEAADATASLIAAAQPPAVPLPPTGTFFEPDPLLLDHWATNCPPPPALPSSLDLINNFLRRQPRLTRPAMLPPPSGVQADLSVRSTRAESDLASESLARILVRQGKTARAIEIYEKLMVKQPEKMAYFAAQIQSLQPPA